MIYQFNIRISHLLSSTSLVGLRSASLSSTVRESNLAKLRRKTGFAFTLCKKALELHNNDLNAAELYLKEESIKHGYAKAQKLKSRRAAQGLIGLIMDKEFKQCALLEVNCETDFVARNSHFKQLAARLTSSFLSTSGPSPSTTSKSSSSDLATKSIFTPEDLNSFNDHISKAVTQLGENIKLSRAILFKVNDRQRNDLLLFGHAHASGDFIADIDNVKLGKYGSAVLVRQLPPEERKEPIKHEKKEDPSELKEEKLTNNQEGRQLTDEEIDNQELDIEFIEEKVDYTIDDVGKILCQQVIGMSPNYLKKSPELLAKEKELADKGFKIPEDSEYLLDQKTIVDSSLSVSQFCDNHGVQILDFVRYECGETVEE